MTRTKQHTQNATTPAPEGVKAPRPPQTDLDAYDRQLKHVFELQAITSDPSWAWFFGGMLSDSVTAAKALKSCEKMNDVIRCQATIAYVENQLARLRQPTEDLNAMRERWPLFFQDHPYRADFDELTGRVTVIHLGDAACGIGQPEPMVTAGDPKPRTAEPGDPFDD